MKKEGLVSSNEKLINSEEVESKDRKFTIREVIRMVSKHLEQPVVLPEDNFFDLGGDSLTAMKLKIDLESQFSIEVSLKSIMLTETIDEFANELVERMRP
ncbi:Phosphopantetheine attachment site [Halobacillus karajensis]|uniref:phosphopantetheine-binding protein n=1 Tax=Halobacillus karajensis TaxID=195088 RepID=UPI0008A7D634|nr:phosphopantetheine-binding protein [Halobacillus karajensis]SEH77107.1 Phosphopantetheine attachment site [Halobacillus karajensis]